MDVIVGGGCVRDLAAGKVIRVALQESRYVCCRAILQLVRVELQLEEKEYACFP